MPERDVGADETGDTPTAREVAIAAMHRHGRTVREREVGQAVDDLGGEDLDPETREAIERLGSRLVAGILASPTAGLLAGEDAQVRTAMSLFGDAADVPSPVDSGTDPNPSDGPGRSETGVSAGD